MGRKKKGEQGREKRPEPASKRVSWGLLAAVFAALLLREVVLEPFRIPSSSMEPALVGHKNFGDRVFCGKGLYRLFFGAPKRWQVLVFVKKWKDPPWGFLLACIAVGGAMAGWGYSRSRGTFNLGLCVILAAGWFAVRPRFPEQNYIKRVVGLPGNRLQIRTGDIFIDGAIERKPRRAQRDCWHEFHRAQMRWPGLERDWRIEGEPDFFTHEPGEGRVRISSSGQALLSYAHRPANLYVKERRAWVSCPRCGREFKTVRSTSRLRARCPGCGRVFDLSVPKGQRYPASDAECVPVADLRLRARAKIASGAMVAVLGRGVDGFELRLSRAGEAVLSGAHGVKKAKDVGRLEGFHEISFWHADMSVGLEVDGEEVFDPVAYDAPQPKVPPEGSVRVGCKGGDLVIEGLALDRDVYYLDVGEPPERLDGWPTMVMGPDDYFFLGDNSPGSNDSRRWGAETIGSRWVTWKCKKRGDIVGKAMFIFWPPSRARPLW